ncbi:MAG: DUF262 domain-containing HNH endonuclease family protein [Pseudomonadota bacterium]
MFLGVNAESVSVKDVFSSSADMRMPPYQRGYSWTQSEAGDLLSDLRDACTSETPYFLGAIVVIQEKTRAPSEVVDGQQRLTTLTILLAVLRDLAEAKDDATTLHTLIGQNGRSILGDRPKWRLTLNHVDTPFFREVVQKRGATQNAHAYTTDSESRANMLAIVDAFREELAQISPETRTNLANFIMNSCAFVRVRVQDRDAGYRVFRVLNTRGKQLSAHDILKSDLFERAGFSNKEAMAFSVTWSEFNQRLSSKGFDDLLQQIRTIYDKSMRGALIQGFRQSVLRQIPARRFISDALPKFVQAYEQISGDDPNARHPDTRVAARLGCMRALEHGGWRAPALKYLVDHAETPDGAARFFDDLERIAFHMQLVVVDREARARRYRRIMTAMADGEDMFALDSPLNLQKDEKKRLSDRLRSRINSPRQRRAIALRLNAALPDGEVLSPEADATLEHILPRHPKNTSDWMRHWSDDALRRELVDTLGNFALLTLQDNQAADRVGYDAKREIFFRNGGTYALTREIKPIDDWTPDHVAARRDRLADALAQDWKLI